MAKSLRFKPILLRRFILCPSHINKNKANLEARFARHAKLETQIDQNKPASPAQPGGRKSLFAWPIIKLQRVMGISSENTGVARLARKIVAISAVFFIFSSIGPMYNLTEGNFGYEELDFIDFMGQETDSILADIMTEDGFLLKPALNSSEGDRSTANEIFAYEVEPGDTLSSLAQRFGIKKETLIMENNLWNENRLRTGMMLKILPVYCCNIYRAST